MSCRALYKLGQDDILWEEGCRQLWDEKTLKILVKRHRSYRTIFIKTPRPNISEGLYVAQQAYWCEGSEYASKSGWGTQMHHVTYRRYLRLDFELLYYYTV